MRLMDFLKRPLFYLNPKDRDKNVTTEIEQLRNDFINQNPAAEETMTSLFFNTTPNDTRLENPHKIDTLALTEIVGKKISLKIRYKKSGFCPDRLIIEEVWGRNIYCEAIKNLGTNHTIIDIGAHIGSFAIYAACIARKGKVYAYEPYLENFQLLKENIHLNKIKNITPFNLGVSDDEHYDILYLDKDSDAAHSMLRKSKTSLIIQCTTLKKIFEDNNIPYCHLLKIDCEGEEYKILLSMTDYYFAHIGKIVMEYHDIGRKKKYFQQVCSILKRNGFYLKIKLSPPSNHKKYDSGLLFAVKNLPHPKRSN